jgi:hypothetical protein
MTGDKMRRIQSRVKKLSRLFPARPTPTPEQVIRGMALQQLSGEDLMVLRRMILSEQAGRSVRERTERESQALDAYHSAFAQEARQAGYRMVSGRRQRACELYTDNVRRS